MAVGPAPRDLFMHFVAAVIIAQRRRILDECHDHDEVLRLFTKHSIDFWECMDRAVQLRAQLEGRKQR